MRRQELADRLAVHPRAELAAVLEAAEVSTSASASSRELAEQLAQSLWWSASTPIGYYADRLTLDDITDHLARRLRVAEPLYGRTALERVDSLAVHVLQQLPQEPVGADDLDPHTQRRLTRSLWRVLGLSGSSLGAIGARWSAGKVLGFLSGPIGRWLPLIPQLRPWVGSIRTGASTLHMVSGPLGLALAALSLNQALGPDERRLLPLLFGAATLARTTGETVQVV